MGRYMGQDENSSSAYSTTALLQKKSTLLLLYYYIYIPLNNCWKCNLPMTSLICPLVGQLVHWFVVPTRAGSYTCILLLEHLLQPSRLNKQGGQSIKVKQTIYLTQTVYLSAEKQDNIRTNIGLQSDYETILITLGLKLMSSCHAGSLERKTK